MGELFSENLQNRGWVGFVVLMTYQPYKIEGMFKQVN